MKHGQSWCRTTSVRPNSCHRRSCRRYSHSTANTGRDEPVNSISFRCSQQIDTSTGIVAASATLTSSSGSGSGSGSSSLATIRGVAFLVHAKGVQQRRAQVRVQDRAAPAGHSVSWQRLHWPATDPPVLPPTGGCVCKLTSRKRNAELCLPRSLQRPPERPQLNALRNGGARMPHVPEYHILNFRMYMVGEQN